MAEEEAQNQRAASRTKHCASSPIPGHVSLDCRFRATARLLRLVAPQSRVGAGSRENNKCVRQTHSGGCVGGLHLGGCEGSLSVAFTRVSCACPGGMLPTSHWCNGCWPTIRRLPLHLDNGHYSLSIHPHNNVDINAASIDDSSLLRIRVHLLVAAADPRDAHHAGVCSSEKWSGVRRYLCFWSPSWTFPSVSFCGATHIQVMGGDTDK